jgi:hypothetical protein
MSTVKITKLAALLTPLVIRRATLLDVDRIAAIEKKSFYNGGGHARFLALQIAIRLALLACAPAIDLLFDGLERYRICELCGTAGSSHAS